MTRTRRRKEPRHYDDTYFKVTCDKGHILFQLVLDKWLPGHRFSTIKNVRPTMKPHQIGISEQKNARMREDDDLKTAYWGCPVCAKERTQYIGRVSIDNLINIIETLPEGPHEITATDQRIMVKSDKTPVEIIEYLDWVAQF